MKDLFWKHADNNYLIEETKANFIAHHKVTGETYLINWQSIDAGDAQMSLRRRAIQDKISSIKIKAK